MVILLLIAAAVAAAIVFGWGLAAPGAAEALTTYMSGFVTRRAARQQMESGYSPLSDSAAKGDQESVKRDDMKETPPELEYLTGGGATAKTIGLVGGIMLLMNNLAGPTIVMMPALAQEAGWLSLLIVQVLVACLACLCGLMLIEAMKRMPGNSQLEQRVEFANLARFYLPYPLYIAIMMCYHVNTVFTLMSLIIQSGQCIDYLILNVNGCAPGLILDEGLPQYTCGTRTDSITPFGDGYVFSCSMVIVGAICAPFALMNLDDNVILQTAAMVGLGVMTIVWLTILMAQPDFPGPLPVATSSQSALIGTVLFNFAFVSPLPSWVNEKKPEVSVNVSFGLSCGIIVLLYTVVGIIGGMAYQPFYMTDENLFSKINASGSRIGQATVIAYPMLQNFTSIPVFSILIRYNLIQSKVPTGLATLIAVGLPWVLSVLFYTGHGFETISEVGGLATSSVINFVAPVTVYILSISRTELAREGGKGQSAQTFLRRSLSRWLLSGDSYDMKVVGA